MIVNPQLFNYRLIIGSLVIAIVILGSFSFSSYNSLKGYQEFVEQEKSLVENELSEMISRYELVDVENRGINLQLEETKAKIKSVLDSVKTLKSNVSLISRLKVQLKLLQEEKKEFLQLVGALENENKSLKNKSDRIANQLEKTVSETHSLQNENVSLSKINSNLKETIEEAKQLTLANVKAQGVKRITSKRIVSTENAGRTNQLHISFTLVKNKFAEKGNKDLYIQILDPKSNIVADKGSIKFGKQSLIFSKKEAVNYKNEDLNIETLIQADKDEVFSKGVYFISVFHEGNLIGKTTIELK